MANATHDDDVLNITALSDLPSIGRQGFGLVLLLGPNNSTGPLIQAFSGAQAAVAAQVANNITIAQRDALTRAFSQAIKPRTILVCRRPADVAQVTDFLIVSSTAGNYTIALAGTPFTLTVIAQTAAQIATALAALIDASPLYDAAVVTATTVRVTASTAGGEFGSATVSPALNITTTVSTSAVNVGTALDAARNERDDFYGVCLDSRTDLDNGRLAEWAELNLRLAGAQTSSAAVKGVGADWTTVHATNPYLLVGFRASDASYAMFAWLTYTLSCNLDRQTTQWSLKTISGEIADVLTDTEKGNLRAKNVNYYLTLKGVPCWREGKTRRGQYADQRTTLDWTLARSKEALATLLLNASNRNEKIPFDDEGIATCQAVVFSVLLQGEAAGHFAPSSSRVRFTPYAELNLDDRNSRRFVYRYGGVFGGAVETFDGEGYFSADPAQLDSIFAVADETN